MSSLRDNNFFQGVEHQPFTWNGGEPAALLVHGFPGTPAEMHALAKSLHQLDWTVEALLLPGFGPQIETVFERDYSEWVAAVRASLTRLSQVHRPVLLIGYSMGAAVAIQAAATQPPSGLVLLAPFWQLGEWWQRLIGLLFKPFFRSTRPFKNADFSDPYLRQSLSNFFPGMDLDDPAFQEELRTLTVPFRILEQLYYTGQTAYRLAPQTSLPTLVIQGTEDEVVPAKRTRQLLQRLAGPLRYEEVITGHNLIRTKDPGWPYVEGSILSFARSFQPEFSEKEVISSQESRWSEYGS